MFQYKYVTVLQEPIAFKIHGIILKKIKLNGMLLVMLNWGNTKLSMNSPLKHNDFSPFQIIWLKYVIYVTTVSLDIDTPDC